MALDGIPADATFHFFFPDGWLDEEILSLLKQEHHEFEAVLGVPVHFGTSTDGGPQWTAEAAGADEAPSLAWDPGTMRLVSRATDRQGLIETFSLLQTLAHAPVRRVHAAPAVTVGDAVDRLRDECINTYPYFGLRGINRDAFCAEVISKQPSAWDDFVPWAKQWIAGLGDAHTAIVETGASLFHPLYTAEVQDTGVRLLQVPPRTAAYAAGVRPGWVVRIHDPSACLAVTGASPQQRARIAARRALAVEGEARVFTAVDPMTSRSVSWTETAARPSLEDMLSVERNRSGALLLTLRAFDPEQDIESVFDEVAASANSSSRMVLDLRGNTGGNIMLANRLRDRFLRKHTTLGSVSFTDGRGGLSAPAPREADPASHGRWPGRLLIVTDASTYSAAEDFILGLQGLEHVTVVGERTGGGSGRPRVVPLGPGCLLQISTAITYDRQGRPVEFFGLQPERPLVELVRSL